MITTISINDIYVKDEFNPRQSMDDTKLEELKASIDEEGLLQPLVVSPVDKKKGKYFLVCGHRRLRALMELGHSKVNVTVHEGDDEMLAIAALAENLQREEMNPYEEAKAIQKYIKTYDSTQSAVAKRLGKSTAYVSNRLKLLEKSTPELQQAVNDGVVAPTAAQKIVTLPEKEQTKLVKEITSNKGDRFTISDIDTKIEQKKLESDHGRNYLKEIREAYAEHSLRSKNEVMDAIAQLTSKLSNSKSDKTIQTYKAQIAALEWALEVRDVLF